MVQQAQSRGVAQIRLSLAASQSQLLCDVNSTGYTSAKAGGSERGRCEEAATGYAGTTVAMELEDEPWEYEAGNEGRLSLASHISKLQVVCRSRDNIYCITVLG